jgi:hypothetical protein
MKIIFMLRDPVERAYSAYWMWRRHNANLPPFRDMLAKDPSYISRGMYYQQIAPYIKMFGAEKVSIFIYEEVMASPDDFFKDLFEFLGVNPDFRPKNQRNKIGSSKVLKFGMGFVLYKVISPIINSFMFANFWRWVRTIPFIKSVILQILKRLQKSDGYPPIEDADKSFLRNKFKAENEKLFKLIERRIDQWD